MYEVVFFNAEDQRVRKVFTSPYQARVFVQRLRHSKRCRLVAYPAEVMM